MKPLAISIATLVVVLLFAIPASAHRQLQTPPQLKAHMAKLSLTIGTARQLIHAAATSKVHVLPTNIDAQRQKVATLHRVLRRSLRDRAWLHHLYVQAQARIAAARWPPHHALWTCIHNGEGAWHDPNSGNNGHYGGLQMHPGWGYGTAYYANNSSQFVQEWAAEHGYRASGYSRQWLNQQWGQTIGPCWGYV